MYKTITFFFFLGSLTIAQLNVELIGHLNGHSSAGYNDIWGYSDQSGNEYALLGVRTGTSIISLINPANPVEVTFIPGTNSIWRDIKVYQNYAYIVSDQTSDGLQIVDLSMLPDTAVLVNTITTYFERAHNIFIDNGYAYVVGTENGGGMHILDLSSPTNPVETAYYTQSGYVHDVYVWNDTVVVCAGNSQNYHLVDVTDKFNPVKISESTVLPGIYAHSGWMTEDKRYFYGTEESNVRDISVWDLQDRTSWNLVIPSWENQGNATVHNLFIKGNYAHISYYTDGYVVLDISSPENPVLVGHYDTNPNGPSSGFEEAWGCYPYLPSGLTLISDIETGLYVFKFTHLNIPPSIQHTEINFVNNSDPVNLTAKIIDDENISEANLFYRTIYNGNISSWSLITGSSRGNGQYEFIVPGFQHLTKVEYYFAALDDSNSVVTLPSGGSGTNPAGNIPPSQFFSYLIGITVPPVILSTIPLGDTTVVVNSEFDFKINAGDTTGLPLQYSWEKNGGLTSVHDSIYHYAASSFLPVPRTDHIKAIVSNGFFTAEREWSVHVQSSSDINNSDETVLSYRLDQNYPNPFNPSTTISFSIPQSGFVNLSVYNLIGEKVAGLINEFLPAGNYNIKFDAESLTSGIYFARINAGSFYKLIKMTVLK